MRRARRPVPEAVLSHRVGAEVADTVHQLTTERLKQVTMNANRRPSVGLRLESGDHLLVITPDLFRQLSPESIERFGLWASYPGFVAELRLKCFEDPGASGFLIKARIESDGRMRVNKWLRDMAKTEPAIEQLKAMLGQLTADPATLFTQSRDRCCMCGRKLTDPLSRGRGVGPECVKSLDWLLGWAHRKNAEMVAAN